MNCKELATDFERVRLIRSVDRINDLEELKKIAVRLIEVNYGMREQFKSLIVKGWLHNDK
jgi:hypothetical protein